MKEKITTSPSQSYTPEFFQEYIDVSQNKSWEFMVDDFNLAFSE